MGRGESLRLRIICLGPAGTRSPARRDPGSPSGGRASLTHRGSGRGPGRPGVDSEVDRALVPVVRRPAAPHVCPGLLVLGSYKNAVPEDGPAGRGLRSSSSGPDPPAGKASHPPPAPLGAATPEPCRGSWAVGARALGVWEGRTEGLVALPCPAELAAPRGAGRTTLGARGGSVEGREGPGAPRRRGPDCSAPSGHQVLREGRRGESWTLNDSHDVPAHGSGSWWRHVSENAALECLKWLKLN